MSLLYLTVRHGRRLQGRCRQLFSAPYLSHSSLTSSVKDTIKRRYDSCFVSGVNHVPLLCLHSTAISYDTDEKKLFPRPLVSLNNLSVRLKSKIGSTISSKVSRTGGQFSCELHLDWPESCTYSAIGETKKIARAKAASNLLLSLYSQNYIDADAAPILKDSSDSCFVSGGNRESTSCSHSTESSHDIDMKNLFPRPLVSLNNLIGKLKSKIGSTITSKVSRTGGLFTCELHLDWPESCTYSAIGKTKKIAQGKAASNLLLSLYSQKYIHADATPVLKDIAKKTNTLQIDFNDSTLHQIDNILKMYNEEVIPAISMSSWSDKESKQNERFLHPTLGVPFPSCDEIAQWNVSLSSRKKTIEDKKFPIDDFKEEILNAIRKNRVIVLKGDTGCGKTTRVPQFILDDAISRGEGASCNIAVTQPRRLASIAVAKYVAKERGERIGESIGYSVRMDSQLPTVPGGSILFLTSMALAPRFTGNTSLQGVSHVILDEAHVRDIGTDLLMTLLKQALKLNENLRVIIMSATPNSEVFRSYFSCFNKVPIVSVPGRTFPVKMHFLDDLPSNIVASCRNQNDLEVNYDLVRRVVLWINKTKPAGGILVFVSGWGDMVQLQKVFSREKDLLVIPVHSMFRNFSNAFEPAPEGKRKVILATNIAETSVTFPDIVYVIDCGLHKKSERDLLSPGGWSSQRTTLQLVTKANVKQRAGRAGRVQPGESFSLFTERTYRGMEDFEEPNILLESLEFLILSVKMVNPDVKATDLLKQFPTPPSEEDILQAVHTLQATSLLSEDSEVPTPLASAVMKISSSLPSALALIYSAIFRSFTLTSSVLVCEECRLPFSDRDESASHTRSFKKCYHGSSDHLAMGKALHDFDTIFYDQKSYKQARALQSYLRGQIRSMRSFSRANLDAFSSDDLVLSILLSCFGSIVMKFKTAALNVPTRDKSGIRAAIRPSSINYKSKSPFMMYLSGVFRDVLLVKETSIVSPLSVLLFLPGNFQTMVTESFTSVKVSSATPVKILTKNEHFLRIQALRNALQEVRDYFVLAEALDQPDENYQLMCHFREMLLICVKEVLKSELNAESEMLELSQDTHN